MVWSRLDKKDGRLRYIRKYGNFYVLTKDKHNAENHIPSGWEVVTIRGHLKLRKKR